MGPLGWPIFKDQILNKCKSRHVNFFEKRKVREHSERPESREQSKTREQTSPTDSLPKIIYREQ
jgi:hypothetical protein